MATWTFAISGSYAERVGEAGVAQLIDVLTQAARQAPGRDVKEIKSVLESALEKTQLGIPGPELDAIASNLSLHDLETVLVTDDVGRELARVPVANRVDEIPVEERSDNVHLEPEDPRRPHIS